MFNDQSWEFIANSDSSLESSQKAVFERSFQEYSFFLTLSLVKKFQNKCKAVQGKNSLVKTLSHFNETVIVRLCEVEAEKWTRTKSEFDQKFIERDLLQDEVFTLPKF